MKTVSGLIGARSDESKTGRNPKVGKREHIMFTDVT